MAENMGSITSTDVKRGLLTGKVRLVSDPYGCVMCNIGDPDYRFYFGGTEAEDTTPWQYACDMQFDEIVLDIVLTLADFHDEFPDEWLYYRYVLNDD